MTRMNCISRLIFVASLAIVVAVSSASNRTALATLPLAGDLVFGLSQSDATKTLELVRGPATSGAGVVQTSPWITTPFIEVVKFDNLGGIAHNVNGNLVGVDFGSPGFGGQIYSFATTGSDPAPAGQLIVDTTDPSLGTQVGGSVIQTRLGEMAVSPDNSKIAATGYDAGDVLVYDYTAGNGTGTGASAANGRQTPLQTIATSHTQGVTWKDNNTVLVFSSTGKLLEVNSTTMAATVVKTVDTLPDGNFTSLTYNPSVSPYIYATYGGFVTPSTVNKLYVLDPANAYNVVKTIDLSTSLQTARDSAIDTNGNLFLSQFGGTGSPGAAIDFLPAANVLNPSTLTDNSSIDWYTSPTLASFSGLDIGFGPAGVAGDFNSDGTVNAGDYVTWKKNQGTSHALANDNGLGVPIGMGHYNLWRANFGKPSGAGSGGGLNGADVPEPTTLVFAGLAMFFGLVVRRHGYSRSFN